jgi:hypothetical protein
MDLFISSTHFLTNSIAIADILSHLIELKQSRSCGFEISKSSNAFIISCVGAYVDLVGLAGLDAGTMLRTYGWVLFSESCASAALSVACWQWGRATMSACQSRAGFLDLDF